MTTLRKFKFVELPSGSNPLMNRRVKLIRKIEEQIKLAADPHYVRIETHMKGKGAERHQVRQEKKVASWAKEMPDGSLLLVLRSGGILEVEPGKPGIVVPSKDELPGVLNDLVTAVRNSELDNALSKVIKTKPKKATNAATAAAAKVNEAAANASAEMKKRNKVPA
jgi:Family of unknown function (DUF6641)